MRLIARITTVLVLAAAIAAVAVVIAAPSGAEAGNAVATCTKAPDLRYDCTKLLAVNDHIVLNANGGTCHANVTATGTISATLKPASLSINHNVSNCWWQSGSFVAIGYRVVAPTPTGGPVSVGGVAGLVEGGTEGAPASTSGGSSTGLSIALVVAATAVGLAGAAAIVRLRSKAGTVGK
jgi:hypothetical protein